MQHDPLVYERVLPRDRPGPRAVPRLQGRVSAAGDSHLAGALCALAPAGNLVRPDAGDRDGRGERGADACRLLVDRATRRRGRSLGRMTWYAAFFLALCPVALCRFDLVPALLGFLAATCWFGRPSSMGRGLAAIGTLVKLFPAAVAAPGMAVDLRERSVVAVGNDDVPADAPARHRLAGSRWAGPGSSNRSAITPIGGSNPARSTPGSCSSFVDLMACRCDGRSTTSPWSWRRPARDGWRRWRVPFSWPASSSWRSWPFAGVPDDPLRWPAAATLGFLCFGKVLSPQYLLWFLPFAVALEGRLGRRVRPPLPRLLRPDDVDVSLGRPAADRGLQPPQSHAAGDLAADAPQSRRTAIRRWPIVGGDPSSSRGIPAQ